MNRWAIYSRYIFNNKKEERQLEGRQTETVTEEEHSDNEVPPEKREIEKIRASFNKRKAPGCEQLYKFVWDFQILRKSMPKEWSRAILYLKKRVNSIASIIEAFTLLSVQF